MTASERPRFAANLSMLFQEVDVLDRFRAAAAAGFTRVELLFPWWHDVDAIERELKDRGLEMVLFDTDPGDFAGGERGFLCHPGRPFLESVRDALRLAKRLGVKRLNALAGKVPPGVSIAEARATAVDNLRRAAPLAEDAGVTLLVEGLNTIDNPGYLVDRSALGFAIVEEVDSPALRYQYDVYHATIMGEKVVEDLRSPLVGHVQIADVPGRHEPGTGTIDWKPIFAALKDRDLVVSLEYQPLAGTVAGLDRWLPRNGRG
ncbi:MAG TPA: TIM barrel protein [Planctomycetota bacterium]